MYLLKDIVLLLNRNTMQETFTNKPVKDILSWFLLTNAFRYVNLIFVDGELWSGTVNNINWNKICLDVYREKVYSLNQELNRPEYNKTNPFITSLKKILNG